MTQQAKPRQSAFPELTRVQLEELCLRQNQRVEELLAALKVIADCNWPKDLSDKQVMERIIFEARAAITKAEGR